MNQLCNCGMWPEPHPLSLVDPITDATNRRLEAEAEEAETQRTDRNARNLTILQPIVILVVFLILAIARWG